MPVLADSVSPTTKKPEICVYNDGQQVSLTVNDEWVNSDQPPYINNGTTMVPIRFIVENLGAHIDWDKTLNQVKISGSEQNQEPSIILTIGSNTVILNGNQVILNTPAVITNNRTMVPLRFVAQALGADLYYKDQCHVKAFDQIKAALPNVFIEKDGRTIYYYGQEGKIPGKYTKSKFSIDYYNTNDPHPFDGKPVLFGIILQSFDQKTYDDLKLALGFIIPSGAAKVVEEIKSFSDYGKKRIVSDGKTIWIVGYGTYLNITISK
jgi:hypothetical protein